MSKDLAAEVEADVCCANCGKAEIDDVKLQDCPGGCDLARYCGDDCQQHNLDTHEAICEKRAAELRDEILFRQPESTHLGDCPICFLPLPLDIDKSGIYSCCGKIICDGCSYANEMHEINERLKPKCPFCRRLMPDTEKEAKKNNEKRAANDPIALREMGGTKYKEGDYVSAFEYLTRAAELGDVVAHYNLSLMHKKGEGVEKDKKMEMYHLEVAAIGGNPDARYNLGFYEWYDERYDRAAKHWIIAANLGDDGSIQELKGFYKLGHVSKDDLAAALRAHQAAVDATKSPQREEAAKYLAS